ncbi:MAG: AraC family transcriptional regulator [Bacteroidota bacterium]
MHVHVSLDELEPPLFDGNLPVSAPGDLAVQEFRIDHPLLSWSNRMVQAGGFLLSRRQFTAHRDLTVAGRTDQPVVDWTVCLTGEIEAELDGLAHPYTSSAGRCYATFSPEASGRVRCREGVTQEVFEMVMTPALLEDLVARYPALVEQALGPVLRGEPLLLIGPQTPAIRRLVGELSRFEDHGSLSTLFAESAALRLLALQLDAMRPEREAPPPRALSSREVDRMHEAKAILLARATDPPSLQELARLVGTNEFALKRAFKATHGTTVFGLLSRARMERAHLLLSETDRPVSEVAAEVGYTPAAFSTAFRRTWGLRPSDVRRGDRRGR